MMRFSAICNKLFMDLKEQYDVKVSVNDIIIKVVVAALRNVPEANGLGGALYIVICLLQMAMRNRKLLL
ncbi:Pyruvate dehydrogenase complex component E2 1 [Trifolium repens]|nr:Pyruvate dehydrogenase complex component E2 1 [Trifolium repens]